MKKAIFILLICLSMILTACSITLKTESPTTTTAAPTTVAATTTTAAPTTAATTTTLPTTTATSTTVATSPGTVLYGSFVGIEWGDYLHVNIAGDDGKDYSFFVLTNLGVDFETIENGTKVKVTWLNVDEMLNPPGSVQNFDKLIAFEIIK